MTAAAFLNALELGFLFGLVALSVYLTFRILDFPDLTVDGSFTTGAALAAVIITSGGNPWLATAAAAGIGALCGSVTALLNRRFGMLHLLAGILTTLALFSVDLRIMGRPNIPLLSETTVFTPFEGLIANEAGVHAAAVAIAAVGAAMGLALFLSTEYGLGMRAAGANPRMARANGINVDSMTYVGLALSNGLVGFAGALFAQSAGFADVSLGGGTILFGLAAVILGEAVFRERGVFTVTFACLLGSVLYRIVVGLALNTEFLGLRSSDLRLVTAVLVAVAFILSRGNPAGLIRKRFTTRSIPVAKP